VTVADGGLRHRSTLLHGGVGQAGAKEGADVKAVAESCGGSEVCVGAGVDRMGDAMQHDGVRLVVL
jgi:hypothetical protein